MVLLLGVDYPNLSTIFGISALLGLAGGFLAWLIGAAGRPGRMGILPIELIGGIAGVILALPCLLLGAYLERPVTALGFKTLGSFLVLAPIFSLVSTTLVALIASAVYARRQRRTGQGP